MKKYILSALALLSFGIVSCKKDYLDTFPTTAVADVDALANTKNAIAALNGIHRIMYVQYDAQGQSGEGACNLFRDYMGEDLVYPLANGSTGHITWYQWQNHRNVNASDMRFVYRFYYRLISNANILINGIDGVPGPDAEKKFVKGSALAYRGWAHFQLVQLYGIRYDKATVPNSQPGVPLMLENLPLNTGKARATVEEVYAQVNKDLNDAETLLTGVGIPGTGSATKSNFTVNVVRGIKARVALAQQDWDAAATNAAAARAGYSLMSNAEYISGFNNVDNQEWIWGSRQIDDHNTFFFSYFAYISCNFNSTVIRTQPKAMNQNLWTAIPSTDVRKLCWDGNIGAANTTPVPPGGAKVRYQNKKFLAKSQSLSVGDVPYMRAGEMFLIEAEARARQGGQEVAARAALNALRQNRHLVTAPPTPFVPSTATGQALIDEIMWNRRVELWGEGHRFTDLKRTNQPMSRAGIPNHLPALTLVTTVAAGDKQWQFLFPQDELNANPLIVQNPL